MCIDLWNEINLESFSQAAIVPFVLDTNGAPVNPEEPRLLKSPSDSTFRLNTQLNATARKYFTKKN